MLRAITRLFGLAVLAASIGFAAPAMAVTTFSFDGTITSSNLPSGGGFPDLAGTAFSGTFNYNELAILSAGGAYNSTGAAYGATLTGGGYTLPLMGGVTQNVVAAGAASAADFYTMYAKQTVALPNLGTFIIALTVILIDVTGNALNSNALVLPSIIDYALGTVQIEVTDTSTNKTAIYTGALAAVPLPAGLPLLGAGLGFLGFMGWRRKRSAGVSAAA